MSIYTDPAVMGVAWVNPKDLPFNTKSLTLYTAWLREVAHDLETHNQLGDYLFILRRPSEPRPSGPRQKRKGGV